MTTATEQESQPTPLTLKKNMSYNKNKFEHNLKKTKRQREFARFERQKLNNLFSIFADVNKNTLNNE